MRAPLQYALLSDFLSLHTLKDGQHLENGLYLFNTNLGVEGMKALAPVLMHLTRLTELDLRWNNLDEASAALILDVILKHHPNPDNVRIIGFDGLKSKRGTLPAYRFPFPSNDFNPLALTHPFLLGFSELSHSPALPLSRSPPIQ